MDATHIILESLGAKGAAQSYLVSRSAEYLAQVRGGMERIPRLARETSQYMHRAEDHAPAEEYREIIEEHIWRVDQPASFEAQLAQNGRALEASVWYAQDFIEQRLLRLDPLQTASDNGAGFDEQHLERIFLPFQRLHGRDGDSGTGMGMAVCKKIVERHGGSITAQSGMGDSGTFIVTLPVCDRRPSSTTPAGVARTPSEPGPALGETVH